MKQTFGRGYPALYHSILLYFILSVTNVIKHAYFAHICSYYASILLFAFEFQLIQKFWQQNWCIPMYCLIIKFIDKGRIISAEVHIFTLQDVKRNLLLIWPSFKIIQIWLKAMTIIKISNSSYSIKFVIINLQTDKCDYPYVQEGH